ERSSLFVPSPCSTEWAQSESPVAGHLLGTRNFGQHRFQVSSMSPFEKLEPDLHKMDVAKEMATFLCCFLLTAITMVLLSRLTFCEPNEIDHFFCDFTPLVHLSCMDTSLTETIAYATSSAVTLIPFPLITTSYSFILAAVLRIPSGTGWQKTFSTCSSHLTMIMVFYGTLIATYLMPSANSSQLLHKGFSLLYTILAPMFQP
ncbi:hypothetical protein DBR06_SOUSAS15110065, partial [Sousa chinensis]